MHISTRLILGGSQENTVLSCIGQADTGHQVELVHGPIHGPEGTLLPDIEAHGGVEPIETPDLVREISPLRDWRCLHHLRQLIRERKPDVVHTHSSKAGILGRMAAWKENVPAVIHTIHGLPFHPYQSKGIRHGYVLAERFAAKRCHRIVTVADAMRDQALAQHIGKPEQYVTVRSGMVVDPYLDDQETMRDARRRLHLPLDAYILGTVSRLAELKGHDDLLEALGPRMKSDPSLHLLWIGDGYWSERLMARVAEMGLRKQVHCTGLIQPQEIPGAIRAMDALIHPSYREGLPRAVVQGLLSAKPVISYDLDGAPEVCIPNQTGFLVTPGDIGGIEVAVQELREHPAEASRMGIQGRTLCKEAFDWHVMVSELERIYTNTLDAPHG